MESDHQSKGKLFAVQVKYVNNLKLISNGKEQYFILPRIEVRHINYWRSYQNLVFLMVFDNSRKALFFQRMSDYLEFEHIDPNTIQTQKTLTIKIPKINLITSQNAYQIILESVKDSYIRNKIKLEWIHRFGSIKDLEYLQIIRRKENLSEKLQELSELYESRAKVVEGIKNTELFNPQIFGFNEKDQNGFIICPLCKRKLGKDIKNASQRYDQDGNIKEMDEIINPLVESREVYCSLHDFVFFVCLNCMKKYDLMDILTHIGYRRDFSKYNLKINTLEKEIIYLKHPLTWNCYECGVEIKISTLPEYYVRDILLRGKESTILDSRGLVDVYCKNCFRKFYIFKNIGLNEINSIMNLLDKLIKTRSYSKILKLSYQISRFLFPCDFSLVFNVARERSLSEMHFVLENSIFKNIEFDENGKIIEKQYIKQLIETDLGVLYKNKFQSRLIGYEDQEGQDSAYKILTQLGLYYLEDKNEVHQFGKNIIIERKVLGIIPLYDKKKLYQNKNTLRIFKSDLEKLLE